MSSKKLSDDQSTPTAHFSKVVKFTAAETDQKLLQAIEIALGDGSYSSFNDLCKQALRQQLLAPALNVPAEATAPDTSLVLLQQQMLLLQQQIAHLEGALGMKQIISLNRLEQQITQLEQRNAEQTAQFALRLDRLEASTTHGKGDVPITSFDLEVESSNLVVTEPALDPLLSDPLLSRLMPLLEDF